VSYPRELLVQPNVASEIRDLRARNAVAAWIIERLPWIAMMYACRDMRGPRLASTCRNAAQMRERVRKTSIAQLIVRTAAHDLVLAAPSVIALGRGDTSPCSARL
jgi:hypothetical protein